MSITISARTLVGFLAGVVTAFAVLWLFQGLRADADADGGATFVAIEPCRMVDTRPDKGIGGRTTPIGPEQSHTVKATGTSGNCNLPDGIVGLSLNATATNASQNTNLRFYPTGGAVPTTSNLNPRAGDPPTPNAVTVGLSGSGRFDVRNASGTVHVILDVAGYYTDELAMRVAELEELTASMSLLTDPETSRPTLRFTGVNVQVVSGSGATTGALNGTGNLIVGYNENGELRTTDKTGSHNLVVGDSHAYTSYGGLVAGFNNTINGPRASVSGGDSNTAIGNNSSVSGGQGGTASGYASSVSGGTGNGASGQYSSVSGGQANAAQGSGSSVSGGEGNYATATQASVSGGNGNYATGDDASVSGGRANQATGVQSSVSGGRQNIAGPRPSDGGCSPTATGSSVSGGYSNYSCDDYASIAGGLNNLNVGSYDAIAGGDDIICAIGAQGVCGEYSTQSAEWGPND